MSEERENIASTSSREWTKFIVLIVVLVGTIFVVAVTRPYIFNRVVPLVMGEGLPVTPQPAEEVEEAYPADEAVPVVPIIEDTGIVAPYPVEETESVAGEELPTAVTTISHTVQHGETLIKIARQYNVTVEAIIAANNIRNPNHIEVGTTLLIPQP